MPPKLLGRWGMRGLAALLLLIFITEVALSTRRASLSWDEGDHIFSGYMNWKHGEYDLNPEHPPLVKLIAALPLLPLDLKVPPRQGRYFKSEAYYDGRELLFRNAPEYGGHYTAESLIFRVHMTVLVFAAALALLLFAAGSEMFGYGAGLIAMTLFIFDPTILTNAPFVTTDMGSACGYFATTYAFYRFAKQMRWRRAVLCGLAAGLTLAAKHSAIAILPMLGLLAAGEVLGRRRDGRAAMLRAARRLVAGLVAIYALAFFVLWSIYSYRFAMHPTGVKMGPIAQRMASLSPGIQWFVNLCMRHHLLPESYLYGLVDVQRVGNNMPAYFDGRLYAHGQWFYFPAILSLKWSAGILGLLALALWAYARGRMGKAREVFFLAMPVAFYLAAAMSAPLNIGVRHVLPVFAFVFLLAAGGAAWMAKQHRGWAVAVALLLAWHVVDSVRMFPNYMPYANVFWGGPAKTHLYFSDSATDWGQELKWTKQWIDQHHVTDCWFAYFPAPFLLPSDYGIPCKLLPTDDTAGEMDIPLPDVVHGPLLVSFSDLNGFEYGTKVRNPYQPLFERTPDDVIANGIAVFYGDFHLPRAAAIAYVSQEQQNIGRNNAAAIAAAQQAVAVDPEGFDANLALGDALSANGSKAQAKAAYEKALAQVGDMEPTAQAKYRPLVEKKLAGVNH
ncbi:phospholipid carrier-dependent glycosyltransferase [Silvibacterium sp.]|uniref:phospholipid carrier-dependent glycosyltransferase n=1 Tax=Silvibacterium sp. TaxID=1964179 RepID=UPI0039E52083